MLTAAFYTGAFPQVHIDVSRADMKEFSEAVTSRVDTECAPHDDQHDLLAILRISIVADECMRLQATIDRESRTLLIAGNDQCLSVFASNVMQLSDGRPGEHEHVEWYEGNQYVEEGSVPIIVSLVAVV